MVSKVAVMAIVGILAVPILLGYALNLNEIEETDYTPVGEEMNVTPLLQNGSAYTLTHGDIYTLNTNFGIGPYPKQWGVIPDYETSSKSSSLPISETAYTSNYPTWNGTAGMPFSTWNKLYLQADPSSDGGYATLYLSVSGTLINTVDRIYTMYYDSADSKLYYTYFTDNTFSDLTTYTFNINNKDTYKAGLSYTNYNGKLTINYQNDSSNTYVDFSKGYHFSNIEGGFYGSSYTIVLPDQTRNFMVTMDLDSITDSDYTINFATFANNVAYKLVKTTTDGQVTWQWMRANGSDPVSLYYDPGRSDNSYQFYAELVKTGQDTNNNYYSITAKMRYVGSWPTLIGQANSYNEYTIINTIITTYQSPLELSFLKFYSNETVDRTPTIRVDDAYFNAFQYPIIENQTYTPSEFKNNPTTTITKVQKIGTSLTFGGNTYDVGSDGNIMLGTHKVSVTKLTLESIPVIGGYENKINGYTVSTTADPSTIAFNGQWSASVSTVANQATTYTKTEWIPGQFAWDGMDTSFLMVGLITSLGVFIALGIYARRSRASVWPLMLVCGGAAALFFIML